MSLLLFRWVHEATGLPMDLSRNDPLLVLALSVVMCVDGGGLRGTQAPVGRSRTAVHLRRRAIAGEIVR